MITLTESAVKKVQEFFNAEPAAKGKALRIAVEAGGCSGYQYAFGFDTKRDGDNEIAADGFSVLIDPQSAGFLKDSKVDYVEDPTGSGFKIQNPNVKKSCGCGQSNQF
ncbi:MAG: iron-sulfur cluster assembly accessory protein [Elusimicrobia bacterium]|nr:iron-sulfur cluster assembly accessory protein [Elusimicrobiota bacterium]